MRNYCPKCRETTALVERGVCQWCDTPLTHKAGRRPGQGCRLTDDQLRVLHAAHVTHERSIRDLAAQVWERAGYASLKACLEGIRNGWRRLGLEYRGRVEATRLASTTHGLTVGGSRASEEFRALRRAQRRASGEVHGRRCEGVRTQYPRKGQPCSRSALVDSVFCFQHDPRNREEIARHLEEARARA